MTDMEGGKSPLSPVRAAVTVHDPRELLGRLAGWWAGMGCCAWPGALFWFPSPDPTFTRR